MGNDIPVPGSDIPLPGTSSGGAATLPSTLILDDAATNTTGDVLVLRHTTSGTAAGSFGATFAVELENASGNTKRAMTDVTTWQVATDGAEYAQRVISLIGAGAMTSALTIQWSAPNFLLNVGNNGLNSGTNLLALHVGGTSFLTCTGTFGISTPFRFETNRGASVAAATTITLGTGGNTFPISAGTGTINSIVATNWQAGSRIVLECASGITITNNVAGTGATVLTSTGASIVTTFTRMIPLTYNGTNWITEG